MISTGKDYTFMQPIFRELVLKAGIKEGDNLTFAGCTGACYAMATLLSFGLKELKLNLYYAASCDANQFWKLEHVEGLGVVATKKVSPVKARVIVLMSGLCRIPFDDVLKFIKGYLASDGKIIGETVVPGLIEEQGWDKHVPFDFIYEYESVNPTSFEVS